MRMTTALKQKDLVTEKKKSPPSVLAGLGAGLPPIPSSLPPCLLVWGSFLINLKNMNPGIAIFFSFLFLLSLFLTLFLSFRESLFRNSQRWKK